jgi:hypothetical protein
MQQLTRSLAIATAGLLLNAVLATTAAAATGPNGLIAYSSWDDSGHYDIYLTDPANPTAPPVRLTTDGRYNSNPDWSLSRISDRAVSCMDKWLPDYISTGTPRTFQLLSISSFSLIVRLSVPNRRADC